MSDGDNRDKSGKIAWNNDGHAIVVDVNDPEKQGRIKLRFHYQQDEAKVPDSKLGWYNVVVNNQPQVRGIGLFPSLYIAGSSLAIEQLDNQNVLVKGALQNNHKDETTQDIVPDAQGKQTSILDEKEIREKLNNVKTTADALKLMNNKTKTQRKEEDNVQEFHNKAPRPAHYGPGKTSLLNNLQTVGSLPFTGNRTTAAKFVLDTIGEGSTAIPGALAMLNNLKTITNPISGGIPLPTGVAGLTNLASAAKGLLDLIKQHKKDNGEDEEEETEEERLAREAAEEAARLAEEEAAAEAEGTPTS